MRKIRDVREASSFGRSAVRNWVYLTSLWKQTGAVATALGRGSGP